jgi:hypothetical protein
MSNFEITSGLIPSALKVVIYGPEGIGKSTFASGFPKALFIDTEGSTKQLPVNRLPQPTSWQMLQSEIDYVKQNPTVCDTLVIDTFDWAENLCVKALCDKFQKTGIEDFGYGKGYIYEKEDIARFLHSLDDVIDRGINVVLTAHAQLRKVEQPESAGTYDHWEMKLGQKTGSVISPIVKEWADVVLFANYQTIIIAQDDKGKKHKAAGGRRMMHTVHTPWWDAKNRFGLPEDLDFLFGEIAHIFVPREQLGTAAAVETVYAQKADQIQKAYEAQKKMEALVDDTPPAPPKEPNPINFTGMDDSKIPQKLLDLMKADGITESEIRIAVARQGIYPEDVPIHDYDDNTLNGLIIGQWDGLKEFIKSIRAEMDLPWK